MKIIDLRIQQFVSIFKTWNELKSEEQKKSINYVGDFIESAVLLIKISNHKQLKSELKKFEKKFEQNFHFKLKNIGESDLNPELVKIVRIIKKIDESDIDISTKRRQVIEIIQQQGYTNLQKFRQEIINKTRDKYQKAHLRNSYNYGEYFEYIKSISDPNKQRKISKLISNILNTKNELDYFSNLVELNKLIDISTNFDELQKKYRIDGVEEHSLINQETQFISGLDPTEMLNRIKNLDQDNFKKNVKLFFINICKLDKNQKIAQKIIKSENYSKYKSNNKKLKTDFSIQNISTETPNNRAIYNRDIASLEITFGYEMEFIINAKGKLADEKERQKNFSDYEMIVKGFADNDSRIRMRKTYGFCSDNIGDTINPLLLFSEKDLTKIKLKNQHENHEKINQVISFIKDFRKNCNKHNKQTCDDAINNISLLSKEEIYFLDLFFLKSSKAKLHKLSMGKIFNWRDKNTVFKEKFLLILKEIVTKGSFYKKTLDMIRANEISIGEFRSSESQEKLDKSISFMRKIARDHSLSIQDRNVQINICLINGKGENLIKIYDEKVNGKLKLFTNQITSNFSKIIQETLLETLKNNPRFERKGQGLIGIEVRVDRRKGLIDKTQNTEYFISYNNPNPSQNLTKYSSAFPIHRKNTGKSSMVRITRLEDNENAIIETRLFANNPHLPKYDIYPRIIDNAIHEFPINFRENLHKKWTNYLKDNKKSITADIKNKIRISKIGKIEDSETIILKPTLNYPPSPIKDE